MTTPPRRPRPPCQFASCPCATMGPCYMSLLCRLSQAALAAVSYASCSATTMAAEHPRNASPPASRLTTRSSSRFYCRPSGGRQRVNLFFSWLVWFLNTPAQTNTKQQRHRDITYLIAAFSWMCCGGTHHVRQLLLTPSTLQICGARCWSEPRAGGSGLLWQCRIHHDV